MKKSLVETARNDSNRYYQINKRLDDVKSGSVSIAYAFY